MAGRAATRPTRASRFHAEALRQIARGATDRALALCDEALRAGEEASRVHNTRGVALLRAERLREAEQALRRAVAADPRYAIAQRNLGGVLMRLGRGEESRAALMCAAALEPNDPENWTALAQLFAGIERFGEATAAAERALVLASSDEDKVTRYVEYAKRSDLPARALDVLRALVAKHPAAATLAFALAEMLRFLERHREALDEAQGLAVRWPGDPRTCIAVGLGQYGVGDFVAAAKQLRDAHRRLPADGTIAVALGNALRFAGDLQGALIAYRTAQRIAPRIAEAHYNEGVIANELGDLAAAGRAYDRALALNPEYTACRVNRAMIRLRVGRAAEAWDDYRYRNIDKHPPVTERWPRELGNVDVVVNGEQGLGDQLFFLRFAPLLAARGAKLRANVDKRLWPLLERIGMTVGPGEGRMSAWLADLPWHLDVGAAETYPAPLRLAPDPVRVARWRERLERVARPWIAVTWRAGGIKGTQNTIKEVPLELLAGTLVTCAGGIVSVQREAQPGEREHLQNLASQKIEDLSDINNDLDDALAVMHLVDCYISVSNTNIHLRCGVDKKSHILVPHPFEWRFSQNREGIFNWYTKERAYLQTPAGDWGPAFAALGAALRSEGVS